MKKKKERIIMAVMARQINMSFEVAPEKSKQFLEKAKSSDAFNRIQERRQKHAASVHFQDNTGELKRK